jgi:hypothetical protein
MGACIGTEQCGPAISEQPAFVAVYLVRFFEDLRTGDNPRR